MFQRWRQVDRAKPPAKNFYLKLSLYMLLIAVLPVLLIGALSYANLKKALVDEIILWNQYVNENSKSAFELNFNQMLYQSAYLITNNMTQDYESVYDSISYENHSVRSPNEDLNGLNEYLFYKKNLIKMMSSVKINNKYIEDIYFYDGEKNMILNTNGSQYTKSNFYDQGWYDAQETGKANFSRMDMRTVNMQGIAKNIVTLIYTSQNKNNSFIVNINISDMYNGIMGSLSSLKGNSYIYSQETDTLVSNTGEVSLRLMEQLGGPRRIVQSAHAGKATEGPYLISWVKSERLGWYFINVKDVQYYYVNIEKSKNVLLVSSAVLLLLLLVLSSFLFLRIYSTLRRLIKDKFNMQNKLDETVPALRNLFCYNLLKGKMESEQEVAAKSAELGLDIPERDMAVLLVHCEEGSNERIRTAFEQRLLEHSDGFCLEMDGQLCCVVHVPEPDMKMLDMRIMAAKNDIYAESDIRAAVGVGRFCHSREELSRGFIEAFEALKYRFLYGAEETIFFEDIKLSNWKSRGYPFEKEKVLRNYIMTGDAENAQHVLRNIIEELTQQTVDISFNRRRQYCRMLISGILKTVDMLGLDIEEAFGADADNVHTVELSANKEDFLRQCSEMLDTIMKYVSRESSNKSSKDMDKLIDFMENNFRSDISLIDAASVVGLNPSYVSRLIKNHTGKSFTDYVADKRMSLAEKLLLTTDWKLDDIAQQIGYQNTYYFIKVFRKFYGTTPNKFRHAGNVADSLS